MSFEIEPIFDKHLHEIDAKITLKHIAPDKSISHRCVIFALLSDGICYVSNLLESEDVLCSLEIAKSLGLLVTKKNGIYELQYKNKHLRNQKLELYCGNSGTTLRLYLGLLSALSYEMGASFYLDGDASLRTRPNARVIAPLKEMGAQIRSEAKKTKKDGQIGEDLELLPLLISPPKNELKAIDYKSSVSSAQLKSALLLAGLFAKGKTTISEPFISRNHSENLLAKMGANISIKDQINIEISPLNDMRLKPFKIKVPNDPSSAFFIAVFCAVIPGICVTLENVLLNKTRTFAYEVLAKMGAKVTFANISDLEGKIIGSPKELDDNVCDITIIGSRLRGIILSENIPWLIDEIPALSIAFALASGDSEVRNAKELRIKESDRIAAILHNLALLGVQTSEFSDGFLVTGKDMIDSKNAVFQSFGDHRIAMSFALICALFGGKVEGIDCVKTSFPNFFTLLDNLLGEIKAAL
ncbi:MAG: 3-phosphoshikimate 1-carboxyvinyltransferase [Helicobacter sp.]|nr:3-phosphoshikimate 1-carboxyvinyltransferase [Helicobacter sp.]